MNPGARSTDNLHALTPRVALGPELINHSVGGSGV
jgi:hypothetical protein